MTIPTDPLFYALGLLGFLISGISKGGFASGATNVAVPVMALAVPGPQAVGIALPVLCAMDIAGLRAFWGQWSRRELRAVLPGAVVGLLLGTWAVGTLRPKQVSLLIGLITLVFLARALLARRGGRAVAPAVPDRRKAGFWGAVSAFTSTVAHAGGPPLAMYLYPLRLERRVLSATAATFFAVLNYAKLVPYVWLGLVDTGTLMAGIALMPAAIAGVYLGIWLAARVSDTAFYRIIHALLFVTGLRLVWDGIS